MQSVEQQAKKVQNVIVSQSSRLMELPPELKELIVKKHILRSNPLETNVRIKLLEKQLEELEIENEIMVEDPNLDPEIPLDEMYTQQMGNTQRQILEEETELMDSLNKEDYYSRILGLRDKKSKYLQKPTMLSEITQDSEDEDDD